MADLDEVMICRCEEVSAREIREAIEDGATTLTGVKRRTGAGMGLCQGRTCRRLIANMLIEQAGVNAAEIDSPTVRPPVRPARVESLLCQCREGSEGGEKP